MTKTNSALQHIIDDAASEDNDTFAISIFNPSDNLEPGTGTAQLVISNDG